MLAIAVLVFLQAIAGIEQFAVLLITPSSALTVLILVALLGMWRIAAIADSMLGFGIRSPWFRGSTGMTFATLGLAVVVMHGLGAYLTYAFYDAGSRIFVGDPGPDRTPR